MLSEAKVVVFIYDLAISLKFYSFIAIKSHSNYSNINSTRACKVTKKTIPLRLLSTSPTLKFYILLFVLIIVVIYTPFIAI